MVSAPRHTPLDLSRLSGDHSIPGRATPAHNGRAAGTWDNLAADAVLYVAVDPGAHPRQTGGARVFPVHDRESDESEVAYLMRVAHQVEEAIAAGGTHLLIPREKASWLAVHPLVTDYFAEHHALTEASGDAGILLALRPAEQARFAIEVEGWQPAAGSGITLVATRRLVEPRVVLRPTSPARGLLQGGLTFSAKGLRTVRLGFALTRPDRRLALYREIVLSLARPGFMMHDLLFAQATFAEDGSVALEFDLKLDRGRSLASIEISLAEEDNWRLHPSYPGGASFAVPAAAPAGARLELHELSLRPVAVIRKGPPWGIARGALPAPYRKPPGRPRDAVLFSSWVPEAGLALGEYFVAMLRRWHADSKIFVGVNHGSSPRWRQRLEASGLDVTIQQAPPTLTMPCDPAGFVAALDAYRRHEETFELVWFGHTKGLGHLDEDWYATGRWTIERMLWSRRQEIARYFANPMIGLYAPHYLMFLHHHHAQTDALQRIYQATCAPLGAMAVSTHFVMREQSVRDFCQHVDARFFREGPGPFGGDHFFFEMAMPNVPIMQGYEPYIEPGLGGSSGQPGIDGIASVLNDWRQNNAVVAIELDKWRQDPTRFRSRHAEHNQVD